MQQEMYRQRLEELDALEGFVQLGCNLPYGPYVLFQRLAHRYPLHYVQFMHQYWDGTPTEGTGTLYRHLPIAVAAVDTLSRELEHYLTHDPKSEEERGIFRDAANRLENRLWIRNFSDPRFTHFLDIDQYTDEEEGLGIESLFYHLKGSTLQIHLTDREGNRLGGESFPVDKEQTNIKVILADYLLHYFSEPGNYSGDNSYLWSNTFSREEFKSLRDTGLMIITTRSDHTKRIEGHHEIIRYCEQNGLSPRPSGKEEGLWHARCPSGGAHTIMISTASNEWGCGFCRKKGKLEKLRLWIDSRERSIQ